MPRMATWFTRLFAQHRSHRPPKRAIDLGLPTRKRLRITDSSATEKLNAAINSYEQLQAAYGYLCKVRKNAVEAALSRADAKAVGYIAERERHLAGQLVTAAEDLKALLQRRGYSDPPTRSA